MVLRSNLIDCRSLMATGTLFLNRIMKPYRQRIIRVIGMCKFQRFIIFNLRKVNIMKK